MWGPGSAHVARCVPHWDFQIANLREAPCQLPQPAAEVTPNELLQNTSTAHAKFKALADPSFSLSAGRPLST